jgi:hypothetical protein
MNSAGTSPTYTDTPISFQLGKYLVALLICLIAIGYIPRRLLFYRKWVLASLVVCTFTYPAFKFITAESGDKTAYLDVAFWPIAALVLALSVIAVSVAGLDKYFRFVFIYSLASTFIEVLLFVTIGRLPALAFEGSLSVRFGGFLDDPNGFAALLFMLMGWAYYRFSGTRRMIAETMLVICVLLTQSFTAFGFLAILALFLLGCRTILRPKPVLVLSLGAVITAILVSIWSPLTALISAIFESRNGSVQGHLSVLTDTTVVPGSTWFFGGTSYTPYESWWLGSVINFGSPWYLLNLCVIGALILPTIKAFRRARNPHHKAVMCGIFLLSCYFLIGNINLPFFRIFPINFLFFLFSYLVFFERIKEDNFQTRERAVGRAAALTDAFNANAKNTLHRPALD